MREVAERQAADVIERTGETQRVNILQKLHNARFVRQCVCNVLNSRPAVTSSFRQRRIFVVVRNQIMQCTFPAPLRHSQQFFHHRLVITRVSSKMALEDFQSAFVGLWSLQRPLVCGAITGLILGHPVQGAVIGATINLVYLGFMSAGGSMPADMGLAGVLGTAYAIVGGLDTDTALALAVPIGILGTIVWAGRMTFDCFFVHMADKYIEEEKYNKIWIANVLLPQILCFCMTAIPCALAAYFGSSYIQGILAMLSGKVLTVFQIIGGLMPALGIAITLQYIFKGESKVFLFIGFLLAVYSKLPLLTLGIIALLVAVVYVQVTSAVQPATAGADYDDEDDEEDD